MTTASDIVTRAFRVAGLNTPSDAIAGEDSVNGLSILNAMLYGWATEGIDLAHSTLTLDDTILIPRQYEEAVVYNLATRVSAEYGSALDPRVDIQARRGFRALQAGTLEFDDDMKFDDALQNMPNTYHGDHRRSGYNIDKG